MTIKAIWPKGLKKNGEPVPLVMLFGDSYKDWWEQLREYCRLHKLDAPTIEVSKEKWIGYGGLKWCWWGNFQDKLDTEGKGRKVGDFQFRKPTQIELNILNKHVGR